MPTATDEVRRLKSFTPLRFKAEGEDDGSGSKLGAGEFIATAAVFGNVDSYGERMVKGAFTDTLAEWKASGDPVPVIWQHAWGDPNAHIGYVLDAEETDEALVYKGRLDIEDNPFAAQVYRLMKGRRVTQQSFGFDILDAAEVTEDGKSIYEITKVHLFEVGPCLVGVNRATNLLDIKSGGVAPGKGAAELHSGQGTPAADAPREDPVSVPDSASASKALTPASLKLLLEIDEL